MGPGFDWEGGQIGSGAGHGEELWAVGQLALPPNEARGGAVGGWPASLIPDWYVWGEQLGA